MADSRIDDLRRRLERDPGSRLFAQLAEELRKAGELEEAIGVARAGLAQHPAYPSARLTLGRALLDSGDPRAARVELEAAVKGAPDNILANRLLGEALESLGDFGGALDRYRATLAVAPGDRNVEGRVAALESSLKGGTVPVPPIAGKASPVPAAPPPVPGPAPRGTPPPLPVPPAWPRRAEPPEPEAETDGVAPTIRIRAPGEPPPAQPSAAPPPVPAAAPSTPEGQPEASSSPWDAGAGEAGGRPAAGWGAGEARSARPTETTAEMHAEPPPTGQAASDVAPTLRPGQAASLDQPAEAPPPPSGDTDAVLPAGQTAEPFQDAPEPPSAEEEPSWGPEEPVAPTFESSPETERGGEVAEPAVGSGDHAALPGAGDSAGTGGRPLSSVTLAELYFQQGLLERAVEVYRQVLEEEPENSRARARLAEVQALVAAGADLPVPAGGEGRGDDREVRRRALIQTIERLEGLLVAVRRR